MNAASSLGYGDGGCLSVIDVASGVVDEWTPKMREIHPSIESPMARKETENVDVSHPARHTVDPRLDESGKETKSLD